MFLVFKLGPFLANWRVVNLTLMKEENLTMCEDSLVCVSTGVRTPHL